MFYSYAYPPPPGFAETPVRPGAAFFSREKGEFVLPYDDVRQAEAPEEVLLAEHLRGRRGTRALGPCLPGPQGARLASSARRARTPG